MICGQRIADRFLGAGWGFWFGLGRSFFVGKCLRFEERKETI